MISPAPGVAVPVPAAAGVVAPGVAAPASRYVRRPEVQREVETLPEASAATFWEIAQQLQTPEAMITAIRRLLAAGDSHNANALGNLLLTRLAPVLAQAARSHFPSAPQDAQDLAQATAGQLWCELLEPGESFWEVHCFYMVKITCSDVAAVMRRQMARERPLIHDDSAPSGGESDRLLSPHSPETRVRLAEGLATLDAPARRAVQLKAMGYPVSSADGTATTIAGLMGVSGRSVHSYLKRGLASLRAFLHAEDAPVRAPQVGGPPPDAARQNTPPDRDGGGPGQ